MKNCLVYKFYNINNELLYVGITNNISYRLEQHKDIKDWFNDVNKIMVSNKMTRNEAHIYEIYYISNENPKYNKDYSKGSYVDFELPKIKFKEYKFVKKDVKKEHKDNRFMSFYYIYDPMSDIHQTTNLQCLANEINDKICFSITYSYIYYLLKDKGCEYLFRLIHDLSNFYKETNDGLMLKHDHMAFFYNCRKDQEIINIFEKIEIMKVYDNYYLFDYEINNWYFLDIINENCKEILINSGEDVDYIEKEILKKYIDKESFERIYYCK